MVGEAFEVGEIHQQILRKINDVQVIKRGRLTS